MQKSINFNVLALSISAALPLCLTPSLALADELPDNIERIEVTGEFRETSIHKVPASVSALSEKELRERSAVHLEDVFNALANVNFSGGASRARFMQIRGIGERSQFVDPIQPSVGILIDGINYSGLGQAAMLFDIGQVEVFRGPQSGRFGANGMAGMINMTSTAPSSDFQGQWQAGVANYDERQAGLALGGHLGIFGNARFSVSQLNNDGFTENRFLDRDDTEKRSELSARLNLTTELSDNWQLQTTLHSIDTDNGYDAFSLDNDRTTLSDEPGEDNLNSQAARLQLNYQGIAGTELQLSGAWLSADTDYSFDEDWTFVGIAPGWEYSSFDAYERERDDRTLEVRWLTQAPVELFGLATNWVVGLYDYQRDVGLTRDYFNYDIDAPSIFQSQYDSSHRAAYAEITQYWSDVTWLTVGLRAERYENDYLDSREIATQPEDTMWGGRVSLSHAVRDETVIYTTLSRGYKTGGVNGEALGKAQDQGLADAQEFLLGQATFAPETLVSSEFGVKGRSLDDTLSLRMALFYNWRDDVQLKSWVNREQSFVGYIDNADSGDSYGAEAELALQATEQLQLFANLGWLRTEIDGFVTEDGMDMTGRDQAQSPGYQFNIGADYWLHDNWQMVLQADGKDSFYFSDSHNSQSDDFVLLHAQLNYHNGPWRVSLWARNLTDEDYAIRGFYFGNDPRNEYVPNTYVQYGEPRRVGLSVNYQF